MLTIATWNINSVRLRVDTVCRLLSEQQPDILCLQELKSPTELVVTDEFAALGYKHHVLRGQKAYNGVAIISRLPLMDLGSRDFLGRGEARHVAAGLENGVVIENFYVPAGGDIPDRAVNPKFGDKLDFVGSLRDWGLREQPKRTILVGDLNIAPLEEDVWSHRQLLTVVSHTPVEVNLLNSAMQAGGWTDVVRHDIPTGKLYSWWSYRARDWDASDRGRRLDHIWATRDLVSNNHNARILRQVRGWPKPSDHVPVLATFDC
ncbi:MAG: exodeoxyribonuclease III [Rhodobacteraceae bacterium]|nr:exodeoxyribonuclease III [Paracoccaceae bacterium]